jgi:hypothetical protein
VAAPAWAADRTYFTTRAYAALLDMLGWQVADTPRRQMDLHAPGQCCFVLQSGTRQEAAFGFSGLVATTDRANPALRKAQIQVEWCLSQLVEHRGVLVQNIPLLAVTGHKNCQLAIFGGWRFCAGQWMPFVLGPGGLSDVPAQELLAVTNARPGYYAGRDAIMMRKDLSSI